MYFDPGFGSIIIQAVIAAIAAIAAYWAIMKTKVRGMFGKKDAAEDEDEMSEEESTEEESTTEESTTEESTEKEQVEVAEETEK